MTPAQRFILERVAEAGRVPSETFIGRGSVVAWCVRNGWLEWEHHPQSRGAVAILITDAGKIALSRT
jgi:hypothetical protein